MSDKAEIYYDRRGNELLDDMGFSCAKKVVSAREHYYVKQATGGIEQGRLFNPISPFYNEGSETMSVKSKGRSMYEYKKVKKEIFDLYIRFLKTQNSVHLKQAERELTCG